jgi:oxygen-independent coproporphyrinogen-3 oxidase
MIKNSYIHIPFCKSKCNYCIFTSFINTNKIDEYIFALKKHIKTLYKGEYLNTLYFGGGTPSLISTGNINELISLFNLEDNAEVTIECNPENINLYNVNRISLGCQTFDNTILSIIGRHHTKKDIENAVKFYQKNNINNISIDLIYGLPNQTEKSFEKDLKIAIDLGIKHISLYGLKIEKGCFFYKNQPKNLPNIDFQADMYLKANEILQKNGFIHYEISNWAYEGYESKHNLNYWNNKTYYGFGCGASGYEKNKRYSNTSSLTKYIQNPLQKDFEEELTKKEQLEEEIILGFRKACGINVNHINEEYSINFEEEYSSIIKKYSNYLIKTKQGYALNIEGMLISNEILSEFT